tara:strand:- start:590 stop:811 length:222 start_codon:yes stop_codon:yes gene_type:complete
MNGYPTFQIYGRKSKMQNDPKVKILEVKDNSFDIYELLSRSDRARINEIILETVASKGYDVDNFDYDLRGFVL